MPQKIISILIFLYAFALLGCSGGESKKGRLMEQIEHFKVDTVVQSPEKASEYPSLYSILRKYPELFHATEAARKQYDKWVKMELNMISVAISQDRSWMAKNVVLEGLEQKEDEDKVVLPQKFAERLKLQDVREALSVVLLDDSYSETSLELTNVEETSQEYLALMFDVAEKAKQSGSKYSDTDIKSSVGYARKRWQEYAASLSEMLQAVPNEYRLQFINEMNRRSAIHLQDLQKHYEF